jgi:hypothetical protein
MQKAAVGLPTLPVAATPVPQPTLPVATAPELFSPKKLQHWKEAICRILLDDDLTGADEVDACRLTHLSVE